MALPETAPDTYPSNSALYLDPNLVETVDYARRYRRHELFGDGLPQKCAVARTTVIAPHGGGIEFGTSELCLAIAGYDPATLAEEEHHHGGVPGLRGGMP